MQGKIRRQRNPLFSSKFPHQACRGKLEDKEILRFQLNFPGKFRRQKRMHG